VIEKLLRGLCQKAAKHLAARHIPRNGYADIYLSRFYLYPRQGPTNDEANTVKVREDKGWGVVLHHFHRSDADMELHSHPWAWSLSLILTGGYREERRQSHGNTEDFHICNVAQRTLYPGDLNLILANDFHRVDLLDPENGAWTLFVHGKRIQSWGFWERFSGTFTPWRKFLRQKAAVADMENALHSSFSDIDSYKRWNDPFWGDREEA
jgi:hypothetical protein